jgi:hypothetical protein
MRRFMWIVAAACGACGGGSGADLTMKTSFVVTSVQGSNPSPLDPLANQTIDFDVEWTAPSSNTGAGTDPAGCKSTTLYGAATRTAHGATATLVQAEILDRLEGWDLRLQLCDAGAGSSSVTVDSAINELNLALGCVGVPASAMRKDSAGYPVVTSFTATNCAATILDVVAVKELTSTSFSMTVSRSE